MKETLVSDALEEFYRQRDMRTICTGNIRRKIRREIGNLRKILKLKSKQKTANQNQAENEYRSALSNVFPIEKNIVECENSRMESDDNIEQNGINFTRLPSSFTVVIHITFPS